MRRTSSKPVNFDVIFLHYASLLTIKNGEYKLKLCRKSTQYSKVREYGFARYYLNKEGRDILSLITLKLNNLKKINNIDVRGPLSQK